MNRASGLKLLMMQSGHFENVIRTEVGVSVEVEVGFQDNLKREGGMHGVG